LKGPGIVSVSKVAGLVLTGVEGSKYRDKAGNGHIVHLVKRTAVWRGWSNDETVSVRMKRRTKSRKN
jgi:hypothetical protein